MANIVTSSESCRRCLLAESREPLDALGREVARYLTESYLTERGGDGGVFREVIHPRLKGYYQRRSLHFLVGGLPREVLFSFESVRRGLDFAAASTERTIEDRVAIATAESMQRVVANLFHRAVIGDQKKWLEVLEGEGLSTSFWGDVLRLPGKIAASEPLTLTAVEVLLLVLKHLAKGEVIVLRGVDAESVEHPPDIFQKPATLKDLFNLERYLARFVGDSYAIHLAMATFLIFGEYVTPGKRVSTYPETLMPSIMELAAFGLLVREKRERGRPIALAGVNVPPVLVVPFLDSVLGPWLPGGAMGTLGDAFYGGEGQVSLVKLLVESGVNPNAFAQWLVMLRKADSLATGLFDTHFVTLSKPTLKDVEGAKSFRGIVAQALSSPVVLANLRVMSDQNDRWAQGIIEQLNGINAEIQRSDSAEGKLYWQNQWLEVLAEAGKVYANKVTDAIKEAEKQALAALMGFGPEDTEKLVTDLLKLASKLGGK